MIYQRALMRDRRLNWDESILSVLYHYLHGLTLRAGSAYCYVKMTVLVTDMIKSVLLES